jgi:hypothetical protein|tara:strand:+ start:1684 stop:2001 length:318 start_codon:yes stop_codon:yes gene_type:complete
MATGRLAAADVSGATLTTVYECPADTYAVVSISICNRGADSSDISLAIADIATPTNGEYIEFETGLLSKNILERTGMVLAATQKIVILSSQASVSAVVVGIETAA